MKFRGGTGFGVNPTLSSWTLPVTSTPKNVMFFAALDSPSNGFNSVVSDPRVSLLWTGGLDSPFERARVWGGVLGVDLSPLQISGNPCEALAGVWTATALDEVTGIAATQSFPMSVPATPSNHNAAIVFAFMDFSVVPGNIFPDTLGNWNRDLLAAGSEFGNISANTWASGGAKRALPPGLIYPNGGNRWGQLVTIGLVDSNVQAIRRWPRDDGAGLSSSARMHPPPKNLRNAGQYQ